MLDRKINQDMLNESSSIKEVVGGEERATIFTAVLFEDTAFAIQRRAPLIDDGDPEIEEVETGERLYALYVASDGQDHDLVLARTESSLFVHPFIEGRSEPSWALPHGFKAQLAWHPPTERFYVLYHRDDSPDTLELLTLSREGAQMSHRSIPAVGGLRAFSFTDEGQLRVIWMEASGEEEGEGEVVVYQQLLCPREG